MAFPPSMTVCLIPILWVQTSSFSLYQVPLCMCRSHHYASSREFCVQVGQLSTVPFIRSRLVHGSPYSFTECVSLDGSRAFVLNAETPVLCPQPLKEALWL